MIRCICLGLLGAMAAIQPAMAQERDDDTRFVFQPYVMLPAMDGKAAVRGIDANVDVGRDDIIDNFNIGFMGYVEVAKGDWAFGVDTNYANLDATKDSRRTSANMTQLAVQPMVFYRVDENLELMGGVRYNSLKVELESQFPLLDGISRKRDWVDPIVGIRMSAPLGDSSRFTFQANAGGFGVGSDIAVQVRPIIGFGVSSGTTIDVGYQVLYMKYKSGSGANRFVYDVVSDGPIVGATFRF